MKYLIFSLAISFIFLCCEKETVPALNNNSDLEVSMRCTSVDIKVKPDDDPIPTIYTGEKGKTAIAIYGSSVCNVRNLKIDSIFSWGSHCQQIIGVAKKNNGKYHYSFEDSNKDGIEDMVIHIDTPDFIICEWCKEIVLAAKAVGPIAHFLGTDGDIRIREGKKNILPTVEDQNKIEIDLKQIGIFSKQVRDS